MRVEGCDSCRHYLKAVDLRKCPDAEPVVDEIGSTPLDIVARERNYTKLEVNIVGV
jgi:formate dehydrogenase maturation protein FdhE